MKEFFGKITNQYVNELPFVVYKKPNEETVDAIFQSDTTINYVKDYSESGFVFAPFDSAEKTIVIPFDAMVTTIYNQKEITTHHTDVQYDLSAKKQHVALIKKGISAITQTHLRKVVLSRVEEVATNNNCPITFFKRALAEYKNAFVYLWYHPKVGCWLGATPEVLLKTRNNKFKTMSLAGTQVFNDAVTWERKEQEEQQIVTDYITDSLGSENIQFNIGAPYTVKAGHLAHIRTDIEGRINSEQGTNNLKRLLSVLHPTPAVCGLPKEEAKTFILKNELYKRKFYSGFLGELNKVYKRKNNRRNTENNAYRQSTTSSNLYVNLRCMEFKKDGVNIFVGGGITASSDPEKEFVETCNKTKTMKKLIIS
ncbi:MAG: chorismate-binding protein [Flavobacteriaceae bacterium]